MTKAHARKSEPAGEVGTPGPSYDPELGTRIGQLLALFDSDHAAAAVAKVSEETLRRYRNLETGLKFEPLFFLASTAGVSMDWLATGAGPMMRSERPYLRVAHDSDGTSREVPRIAREAARAYGVLRRGGIEMEEGTSAGEGHVALPRFDVRASAGVGVPVMSEEVVEWVYFKADWLRRTLGLSPANLALIEAVGDSMSPTVGDGDLLLVDVSQPVLRGEGVYVLAMEDFEALVVKRVEIDPGGSVIISSDNKRRYPARYEYSREQLNSLRIVGRVVWVGGRI